MKNPHADDGVRVFYDKGYALGTVITLQQQVLK